MTLPSELVAKICAFSGSLDLLNAYHDASDFDAYGAALSESLEGLHHALQSIEFVNVTSGLFSMAQTLKNIFESMPSDFGDQIPMFVDRFPMVNHLLNWMMQVNIQMPGAADLNKVLQWGADPNASNMWHLQCLKGGTTQHGHLFLKGGTTQHNTTQHELHNMWPTPLSLAVVSTRPTSIIRLLLNHGAKPDEGKELYHAVVQEQWTVASLLLDHGASLNLGSSVPDATTNSLFIKMAVNGIHDEKGRIRFIQKAFHMNLVSHSTWFLNQCLNHAIVAHCLPLVSFFIHQGADVNMTLGQSDPEIIHALLDEGMRPTCDEMSVYMSQVSDVDAFRVTQAVFKRIDALEALRSDCALNGR